MLELDFEKERRLLEREITFFHFKRAKKRIARCIKQARNLNEVFYFYYFLAQEYILKEDFQEALKDIEKALRIRPDDALSYNDKALCLAELGKHKEAIAVFDEGIKKNRDSSLLYHNKGWLLHLLGKYKEALLYFKKALELDKSRVESLFSLADTYVQLGEDAEAKKYFRLTRIWIKGKSAYISKETLKRLGR